MRTLSFSRPVLPTPRYVDLLCLFFGESWTDDGSIPLVLEGAKGERLTIADRRQSSVKARE